MTYHGVGDLALTERSTAAGFAALAHAAVDAALAAGRVPVVTGGTGLYLRAALADLGFPDEPPDEVRAWAEGLAATDPAGAMDALRARDPEAAGRIDAANPRRVARALALAEAGGSGGGGALWDGATRVPTLLVGVGRPRPVLDARIATRVDRELADGLRAELERAIDTPGVAREPLQVIGAKEVRAIRAGELDTAELPARLAARTRRLARKQLTWLRKTPGVVPLDLGDAPAEDALPALLALWRGPGGDPVASGG